MKLLQGWVRKQAESRPEAPAIVFDGQQVTYAELEARSNQLARILQSKGCRRGDRVCFAIPKSPAAIIALLGIMKADCCHVPIDTSSPVARVTKILESSEPRFVLGVDAAANLLRQPLDWDKRPHSLEIGWMEDSSAVAEGLQAAFTWKDLSAYSDEPLNFRNTASDPAHILFTSGSTGEPKGVVITHSNVIHFIEWAIRYFAIDSSDRLSCHSPLHFDLSYFDIFAAFACGAELHLVPPEVNLLPNKIAEFIRASQLTQWFSVPSVLSYMARFDVVKHHDFPHLKRLLWCGDVFSAGSLIYWMKRLPHVSFTNLYGPTETTIASSYYTVADCPANDRDPIPIGTACPGEELLVLDDNLQTVPVGQTGDLYIRGAGLSPGYWRDELKTSAAFLRGDGDHSQRLYRTGDLARLGKDGLVYFVGRSDSQIKCRGHRVELGEIETSLHSLNMVREAAVVAITSEVFEGNLICCAYASLHPGRDLTTLLRSQLSQLLPNYMLPSRWMCLDRLPINANGKVDRPALKQLFLNQEATTLGRNKRRSEPTCNSSVPDTTRMILDDTTTTAGESLEGAGLREPRSSAAAGRLPS